MTLRDDLQVFVVNIHCVLKKKELTKMIVSLSLALSMYLVERLMGIEPTSQAWEARILPMNYSRIEYFTIIAYFIGGLSIGIIYYKT